MSGPPEALAAEAVDVGEEPDSRVRVLLRSLWRDKAATLGAIFLVLLMVAAIFGPLLTPHSPTETDILNRLKPPFWENGGELSYPLGTDGLGRDELSRLIAGARMSLLIGLSVVLLSGTVGTVLGLWAGYRGGKIDTVIMRLADAQLAFPGLLLVLLVLGFLGPSIPAIIGVIALYGWMIYARLVRGMVLQLRDSPAVQAAEMMGCSTSRILFRHLLPTLYTALFTQAMLELARVILAEASLSYLGVGVQPPDVSWGLMVAESQEFISSAWWTVFFPGLALALTVLAINLVANWLRVESDPAQRDRRSPSRARRRQEEAAPGFALSVADGDATEQAPEPAVAGTLLDVEKLDVRFATREGEVHAVRDARFSIRPGETVGIVGESGSGKSTASLALIDLIPPPGRVHEARIRWEGELIDRQRLRRLRGSEITMIFQDPMTSLNPLVKVGRQVSETLVKHKGMSRAEARERTAELFELTGIPNPRERLDQFPYELSGGLRQRVMIAAALAPEPKLLIADEPTTALDATIQAQILELITDLQERLGIAMLLITHDLGVVARTCDRVVVMYGGRSVEESPSDPLFAAPHHRYTEALLSAVPDLEDVGDSLASIPGRPPGRYDDSAGCPFAPRCAFATKECEEMPPLTGDGPGRTYACWHPVDESETRQGSEVGVR